MYNRNGWKLFSCYQILESTSAVTKSASTLSSLIEYTLGDFVAAIYEVDCHVYMGTIAEVDEPDSEVVFSIFKIRFTNLLLATEVR